MVRDIPLIYLTQDDAGSGHSQMLGEAVALTVPCVK
jgi:hypothetical protein